MRPTLNREGAARLGSKRGRLQAVLVFTTVQSVRNIVTWLVFRSADGAACWTPRRLALSVAEAPRRFCSLTTEYDGPSQETPD